MNQEKMFCFQCEQTIGDGCTSAGNCGKNWRVAALQDVLVYQVKAMGYLLTELMDEGYEPCLTPQKFVIDALFSTLTNVNFDEDRFVEYIMQAQTFKGKLLNKKDSWSELPASVTYVAVADKEQLYKDAAEVASIKPEWIANQDLTSAKELAIYGMKGMSAYLHQAANLGFEDPAIYRAMLKVLAQFADSSLSVTDWVGISLELGAENLKVMELLDRANTESYGNPEPTEVRVTLEKGPFIVISGHDLLDIQQLLEQSQGTGIKVYTHGEMIAAHAYPELKKYPHLAGNYGGAWQNQRNEFDELPGGIVFTTNCIQIPKTSYADRIFTTSLVGIPGGGRVKINADGSLDFAEVIAKSLALGGFAEDEAEQKITVGFGHHATLSYANDLIAAIKEEKINHFFLVGGCDGAKTGRNYYTDFAMSTPKDSLVLTLACGKYRFNKEDLGTVAGFPRLLDMGQCNDAFSAIKVAVALSEAFDCSVNDLPLSMVLSWYEQKAVCILLTLLSLGIKGIYLGPTLPKFLSPNILNTLVETFDLHPTGDVETDMAAMLA